MNKIKNKNILCMITMVMVLILSACSNDTNSEEAENFPADQARIIVFSSAGGSGDIFSRELANVLTNETEFGENVVVENVDGGSGALAINELLSSPADGYNILFHSSTAPLTMASGELQFEPEDLQPLATMANDNLALIVRDDSPYETIEDLIEDAKENPGGINVASSQTYGINHMFTLAFMEETETDLNYIAYSGGGEAMTRLLGGNADVLSASLDVANSQIDSGDVRVLALTGEERRDDHPDVPTFTEAGYEELEDLNIWRGLFVHPDTPQEIQDTWIDYIEQAAEAESYLNYLDNTRQNLYLNTGSDFEEIFMNDYEYSSELFQNMD